MDLEKNHGILLLMGGPCWINVALVRCSLDKHSRFERERAGKENRRPNSFDFLGFNHYCGKNRKGRFILFRKTSNKKFRMKCREMNSWLRRIRNYQKTKEWWPVLQAKLRGHYQYYGVSGNIAAGAPEAVLTFAQNSLKVEGFSLCLSTRNCVAAQGHTKKVWVDLSKKDG